MKDEEITALTEKTTALRYKGDKLRTIIARGGQRGENPIPVERRSMPRPGTPLSGVPVPVYVINGR